MESESKAAEPGAEESEGCVESAETLLHEMDSQIAATQQWTERRQKRLAEMETAGNENIISDAAATLDNEPSTDFAPTDLNAIQARLANARLYTSQAFDIQQHDRGVALPEVDVAALMDGTTKMSAELLRRQMMADLGLSDTGEDATTTIEDGKST